MLELAVVMLDFSVFQPDAIVDVRVFATDVRDELKDEHLVLESV